MMRGACFVYQYTQNPELYAILEATVRDMMSKADEHGRISSYSVMAQYNGWDMWCRKYVMLGMEYFIEICTDEELIKEVTASLCAQADYMLDTIGFEEIIKLSAKEGDADGLAKLERAVDRLFTDERISAGADAIVSSARQHASLVAAKSFIDSAIESYRLGLPTDAASSDIEMALGAIGELDGRSVSETVVGEIFSKFCVGK